MNKKRRFSVLGALCLAIILTRPAQAAPAKIGVLVFDGFLTSDVTAPIEVFGAATKMAWFSSYEVVTISATRTREVLSEEGLRIIADRTIYDDLQLDVLIVPSAYEMGPLLGNNDLIEYIRAKDQAASWMASNCSGAFLLGKAGVLDGKRATTWAGGEKDLAKQFPKIKVQYDTNVVIDHRVITSNGGPISYQAAFKLLERLSSKKFSNQISHRIQFDRLGGF